MTSQSSVGRGTARGRRLAVVGAAVAAIVGLGAVTASAAPVTAVVPAGSGGTLSNGVEWSTDRPHIDSPTSGLTVGNPLTFSFGEQVDAEFRIAGLSETECVRLPVGAVVASQSGRHIYDASTRLLCGRDSTANSADYTSRITLAGTTGFTVEPVGGPQWSRGVYAVTVTVERDPAVVADDAGSTVIGVPTTIDVTGNDTIPDGSTGWDVDVSSSQGGSVVDNGDGTVTYTPPAGFVGTDSFTYRVTGPDGVEVSATVTVTVTEEDEPAIPMVAPGLAVAGLVGVAGLGLGRLRARRGR